MSSHAIGDAIRGTEYIIESKLNLEHQMDLLDVAIKELETHPGNLCTHGAPQILMTLRRRKILVEQMYDQNYRTPDSKSVRPRR